MFMVSSCLPSLVPANSRERYVGFFLENTGLGVFKDSAHWISLFCQLIDRKGRPNCSLTLKMSPWPGVKVWRRVRSSCVSVAARGDKAAAPHRYRQHAFSLWAQTVLSVTQQNRAGSYFLLRLIP